ncbi:polysaccharide biosynthesis tyrosine autokinase [Desulfoplanes formicivorans]|uniref:non-specific protein-tyrosine kinase n=1 Tax=Desulfoplanes formicivorans TaxID=1592317 RepID=A0A194AHW6_9BACT|nr:polysaccharide biosynthesis tyrosine autokinase [Desulfoplanes formicivorans]GAU08918.1 capsular biosynthesis protein [Desulfoplanes formicivorans]
MSKIAKALEKAHQNQTSSEFLNASAYQDKAPSIQQKPIVYTKTRIHSLSSRDLEKFRIMTAIEDPDITDYYSLLRTQVMSRTRGRNQNALMVTSSIPREGKTTTAINLALSIARHAVQTSLLVDMDLRNPDISTYLGLDQRHGLTDYLINDISLDTLLVHPEGMENIVVLPAGKRSRESTELLSAPKMNSLVHELKTRYTDRYVIFDCPSLVNNPDALLFSSYVDAIILVVEEGNASKDKIKKALEMLNGKDVVGLVMNKAS